MGFSSYINIRTFVVLALAILSCFLAIYFDQRWHLNIVLFGLAIGFPLGTSIQTAFKRREKALEYLGLFQASLLTIHYSIQSAKKLDPEKKTEGSTLIRGIADTLLDQLLNSQGDMKRFQIEADKLMAFMEANREGLSSRIVMRILRYLKDALDGAAYLISITRHRTIAGLRYYALFFIHLFVILHGPVLVYQLSKQLPEWTIYLTGSLSALILITLYNIQEKIEYPFDQKGADDVKVNDFRLNI